ncbi:hypothetical protein AB0F96_12335 [Streptomyces sp. NPDC023998]|uniref:hypothetical protein n=1 Tax=Streptomyces sp. NPDC023998 TaxID=3154597 RepID=UPI0033E2AC6C
MDLMVFGVVSFVVATFLFVHGVAGQQFRDLAAEGLWQIYFRVCRAHHLQVVFHRHLLLNADPIAEAQTSNCSATDAA